MKTLLSITFLAVLGLHASACIWDSDTLSDERKKSPDLAKVILGETAPSVDTAALRDRIAKLQAARQESDPAWWNDLAGAHLRLGEAKEAAALLEPVVERFPNDYGIHANLGTAYHLLGRYQEAEKEIARDLDINPDAHFGLEKYHLALLQYLVREPKYQTRHVYVDEFSASFVKNSGPIFFAVPEEGLALPANSSAAFPAALERQYETSDKTSAESDYILAQISEADRKPRYRMKWNLAADPKLREGILYMASLNPKQAACFVMLGIACWNQQDLNLAAAAFEKAIALGSPQSEILKRKVKAIHDHINEAKSHGSPTPQLKRL